jgi:hypothetical protein
LTIDNGTSPLREYRVTGHTFAPSGEISALDARFAEKGIVRTRPIERLLEISSICNDARIAYNDVSGLDSFGSTTLTVICFSRKLESTPTLVNRLKLPSRF